MRAPPRAVSIWLGLAVSTAVFFVGLGLGLVTENRAVLGWGCLLGVLGFLAMGCRALWLLGRAVLHAPGVEPITWVGIIGGGVVAALGALIAFAATMGFSRGRQLRRRGRVLLPELGNGHAWSSIEAAPHASPELRAALANQWRANGKTEHASVAAFARLSLDLMALGAPPELLVAANRDALDEIRHAELCFSLARQLDGMAMGPLPFPEANTARGLPTSRTLALCRLAVDSLVDGALLEGFSARLIAQLAQRCEDPSTTAVLRELAADEGRHSKHGWDVVVWCLEQGGNSVEAALTGALRGLPTEVHTTLPDAARGGAWEHFGVSGEALEAEAYVQTREHVVARVHALLQHTRRAA